MEQHITIIQIDRDELGSIVQDAVRKEISKQIAPKEAKQQIKGTHGLAQFLGISVSKAQKLKNEGVIPFFQNERLVLFDPEKVKLALEVYNKNKRR